MAKTLDELPIAAAPSNADILLIQQNNLDRQIPFGGVSTSLQETLWTNFSPRVVGTVVNVAATANTVSWGNVAGKPTTLAGYGIVDAVRNNADGTITGSLSITQNLIVSGNLTISGSTTQVNTTQLNIADNIIDLNSNLNSATNPPGNLQSGIKVNRGAATAYEFIWDESTLSFRIGTLNSLQAVATRQDSMTPNAIPYWNSTYNRFDSSQATISGSTITGTFAGKSATSGTADIANAVSFNNGLTTSANVQFNQVTANIVYGAVWNDIADFIEVQEGVEYNPGRAYVRLPDGTMRPSRDYMQKGVMGILSDTYGFGVGQKPAGISQLPIAIAGYVLAQLDQIYEPGTPLTCTTDGILTEFKLEDKRDYPERTLAIFDRIEKNPVWNGVEVRGRHWVKVV